MKYKLKKNSGTYMYKKHTIILKATDIPPPPPPPVVGRDYRLSNFWLAKEVNKELKKELLRGGGGGRIWVVLLHHYIHAYKIICFINT
jgi:hypothetical protein